MGSRREAAAESSAVASVGFRNFLGWPLTKLAALRAARLAETARKDAI